MTRVRDLWFLDRALPVTEEPDQAVAPRSAIEELKRTWQQPLQEFYTDALPSAFDVAQQVNLRRPAGTSGVNTLTMPFAGEIVAMSFTATGTKTGGIIGFYARRVGDSNPLATIVWATGTGAGWAHRDLSLPFAGDFQAGDQLYVQAEVISNQQTLGAAVVLWVVMRV